MEPQQQKYSRSHEWIDQRSLALDKAIADKLRAEPALLQRAKDTLQHWIRERTPTVPKALGEWEKILTSWSLEEILALLTSSEEEATRLRQSSPFCGILTQPERLKIFQEYESLRT
jgi:hypothetical protein